VYGQEVVLPIVVNLGPYRLATQNNLDAIVYHSLMMDNIDEVTDKRMRVLKEIEKDKVRVSRAYNKKVRPKSFQVGEVVWKMIFAARDKGHQVWEVVSKLGKTIQNCKGNCRKFIHNGVSSRYMLAESFE
jgi:hypothetical protein